MTDPEVLASARFDERLVTYFHLQTLAAMALSFVGLPVVPFWIFLGRAFHRRQYDALTCELTQRSLKIRRGVLFRVQKTIPLDKITDLAVNEGPILRALGLVGVQVETAGGGQGSSMGHASLPGVVDAEAFRDRVLEERDRVSSPTGAAAPAGEARAEDASVLAEIRDAVLRIEQSLRARDGS